MNNYPQNKLQYSKLQSSKLQNPHSSIWDLMSLGAVSLCLIIFLLQWQQLPFFLDMYYHLAVARGFEAAGGVVGHNFWEYGPRGAPHLYPPIIHLLILGFLKIGLDGITTLRLLSLFMPVSALLTLWYLIKNILSRKIAFFVVFLSLCSSLFMVSLSFTPAATLAAILLLLGVYSIYQNRILSSILIFGMIFYLHSGMAVISILFMIMARAFKIIGRKEFLRISLFSLLIGSPWLFHIIANLPNFSYQTTASMPIGLYPVILIFFIIGAVLALKKIKEYKIFIALFLSLTPMALLYPFRFFCVQGMLGFLIFAGIGLERSYSLINEKLRKNETARKYTVFFIMVLLSYLTFFAPSIHKSKDGVNLKISDSLLTSIFRGKERKPEYLLSSSMFGESFFNGLTHYVNEHSEKGEFTWSNYRYVAGILWTLTGRPTLSYMLREIQNKKAPPSIYKAGLLIIIDEPKGEFRKIYNKVRGFFEPVGVEREENTDIYILINKNLSMVDRYKAPKPLISLDIRPLSRLSAPALPISYWQYIYFL